MAKGDRGHKFGDRKRHSSSKKRDSRGDKMRTAVVGALLALFATLIYQVIHTTAILSSAEYTEKCSFINCKVTCSNILASDDLENKIKTILPSTLTCKLDLQIEKLELPNNKIPSNWLKNLGTEVGKLTIIRSPQIKEIEDGAFSSPYLRKISELAIRYTGIVQLRKDIFNDMIALNLFWLEFVDNTYVSMEENVFYYVDGLTTLRLTRCILTSETIRNMTGSDVHLPQLLSLDLGYNNIDSLESDVFRRIPNLQALYLMNSGLKSLEVGVFDQVSGLKLYHLEGNSLTTLPEGIFPSTALTSNGGIKLNGNPWRCDCDLAWLKELYLNSDCLSKNPSLMCDNGHLFEEEDFCPSSSTNYTIPTTSTI